MIVTRGLVVKVILICFAILCIGTPVPEQPTRLISVDYNPYSRPTVNNYDNDSSLTADLTVNESTNTDRHYPTFKHVYGNDLDAHNSSRNANSNTNSTVISRPLRKSAVIQSIPRKVRGPITVTSSTTTNATPTKLHTETKDYGTSDPTTTIVYATSIPTTPSKTYVNIRPAPLLPSQKYRSTIPDNTQLTDTIKPVMEEPKEQELKVRQSNVLEKASFRMSSNPEQAITTPRSYESSPYLLEQRKRNSIKSIPYARIRTNDDIDEMSAFNRNAFPYPNHKWTNKDYIPKMSPSPSFLYDNRHQEDNYYQPRPDQNLFTSPYNPNDIYPDAVYNNIQPPSPVYIPQQQPISAYSPQQAQQQVRQNFQPLTVRDFDLLLQLLILRERRLHTSQEPYSYRLYDYNNGISQDNNYNLSEMPKQPVTENPFFKDREPKYIENFISRIGQVSSNKLLPSHIREELLFRMLLLALHLQPQQKPVSMARNSLMLPPPYMYLNPSIATPSSSQSGYVGFNAQRGATSKNPVRSVQILGEID